MHQVNSDKVNEEDPREIILFSSVHKVRLSKLNFRCQVNFHIIINMEPLHSFKDYF